MESILWNWQVTFLQKKKKNLYIYIYSLKIHH